MRSNDALLRLQRFRYEEKQRQVADIEMMIADFGRKRAELDAQIAAEEERCGMSDPNHFKYPMTAKSLRNRRDNLESSLAELAVQLEIARHEAEEEEAELRKAELLLVKEGHGGAGRDGEAAAVDDHAGA